MRGPRAEGGAGLEDELNADPPDPAGGAFELEAPMMHGGIASARAAGAQHERPNGRTQGLLYPRSFGDPRALRDGG